MKDNRFTFPAESGPIAIPMTNDLLFKHLLQDCPVVLNDIIKSLLFMDESDVIESRVVNPILMGDVITDKNVILDVNVMMNNSTHIDLEMQVINYHDWPERSLIYSLRNMDDLEAGASYRSIKPSIQIGFLDYQLFKDHPVFYSSNMLMDTKDHHVFTDKLVIGVIDLTNIHLATEIDRRYNLDKWARFFKAETWEELKMLAAEHPVINEAASHLKQLTDEERFRLQCMAREDALRRENGLKEMKEELEASLSQAQSEISDLKVENDSLKDEIADLKKELEQLKKASIG